MLKLLRLLGILVVFAPSLASSSFVPPTISGIDLISGKYFEHSFQSAKLGTVVVFLSVRCPCSNSHEPALSQLAKEFHQKGFQFIAVHSNADESISLTEEHFKKANFSFPVVQDSNAKIADQFEAYKTPHAYILSPKNEILFKGGVDNSKIHAVADRHYLRDALSSIEKGLPIENPSVRVLGCEIKRSDEK